MENPSPGNSSMLLRPPPTNFTPRIIQLSISSLYLIVACVGVVAASNLRSEAFRRNASREQFNEEIEAKAESNRIAEANGITLGYKRDEVYKASGFTCGLGQQKPQLDIKPKTDYSPVAVVDELNVVIEYIYPNGNRVANKLCK